MAKNTKVVNSYLVMAIDKDGHERPLPPNYLERLCDADEDALFGDRLRQYFFIVPVGDSQ